MPPHSKSLQEEGAVFISFKLVKNGVFQEQGERGGEGVFISFKLVKKVFSSWGRGRADRKGE